MSMNEMTKIRQNFPILQEKIQLSSCSQSAMHKDIEEAVNTYLDAWKTKGMDWGGWMQACEHARKEFAEMINAEVDEVAIVSSVSHAVSSIAASLDPTDRNKVLITDFDFPTVGHVWQSFMDQYQIQFLDSHQDGTLNLEDYKQNIDEQTLVVNTSHISFYNGFKQNLKEIAKEVHQKGAYFFVDAYQSLGQTPIDVKEMNVDFLASGLQKYALGAPGIAFLYVKKDIAEQLTPKVTGWFGQDNPFAFDIKNITYAEGAKRFDSGTFPMINGFAAEAGLTILNQYNMEEIEEHLQHLSKATMEEADHYGLTIKSPRDVSLKGSNTAIYAENASEVEQQMAQRGYIVSARNDVIRIAPHFYNTEADVRSAVQELSKLMK